MTPTRPHLAVYALVSTALLAPGLAEAHLVATGMGPICDGVVHFSVSPEDFLPVVILGLFAGLRGPRQARLALFVLTGAWLAGGLVALGGFAPPTLVLAVGTAVLFFLLGGLLAWNPSSPPWVVLSVAAGVGLVRGLDDLAGAPTSLADVAILGGICGCVLAVCALTASVTLPLKRLGLIVAVRVGGSWMAALGLLLAGWIIRYGNRIH